MDWIPSVIALLVLASGCIGGSGSEFRCSVLDERFACEGGLTGDSIDILFTKKPEGDYYVTNPELENNDLGMGTAGKFRDCKINGGSKPREGDSISFQCKPEDDGDYSLHFDLKHSEPASYRPSEGETCLKSQSGWNCNTKGRLSFTIKSGGGQ